MPAPTPHTLPSEAAYGADGDTFFVQRILIDRRSGQIELYGFVGTEDGDGNPVPRPGGPTDIDIRHGDYEGFRAASSQAGSAPDKKGKAEDQMEADVLDFLDAEDAAEESRFNWSDQLP